MTIIIEIYILLCVSLLIFDIAFLLVKRNRNLTAYRKNESFEKELLKEIEDRRKNGSFSQKFAEGLKSKLSHTRNLLVLKDIIDKDPESEKWFKTYIFDQIQNYSGKSDYEQAYYAYVVSELDYSSDKPSKEFTEAIMSLLESKSLYTYTNAMMTLYAIGNTELLLRAIDKTDARNGFYHKKLLVDGLLAAQTDKNEFNSRLVEKFMGYSPYMQDCLLDYFRLSGYDISGLCMKLLENKDTDTQVSYSAMRYFSKYPDKESRKYFLNVLKNDNAVWIEKMLAIQGLGCYDDDEVKSEIRKLLTSPNWYVRVNAVEYMHKTGLTKDQIFDILYLKDKYANESLLYQYRNDKEMTRYIVNTVQMLNMQEETTKVSDDAEALIAGAVQG
ncbi:MAG: hypothetical protein Q4C14_04270 [Bacillota bacterium]|nr:hypothetical protein [Bacillota bacterium]